MTTQSWIGPEAPFANTSNLKWPGSGHVPLTYAAIDEQTVPYLLSHPLAGSGPDALLDVEPHRLTDPLFLDAFSRAGRALCQWQREWWHFVNFKGFTFRQLEPFMQTLWCKFTAGFAQPMYLGDLHARAPSSAVAYVQRNLAWRTGQQVSARTRKPLVALFRPWVQGTYEAIDDDVLAAAADEVRQHGHAPALWAQWRDSDDGGTLAAQAQHALGILNGGE